MTYFKSNVYLFCQTSLWSCRLGVLWMNRNVILMSFSSPIGDISFVSLKTSNWVKSVRYIPSFPRPLQNYWSTCESIYIYNIYISHKTNISMRLASTNYWTPLFRTVIPIFPEWMEERQWVPGRLVIGLHCLPIWKPNVNRGLRDGSPTVTRVGVAWLLGLLGHITSTCLLCNATHWQVLVANFLWGPEGTRFCGSQAAEEAS